MFILPLLADTTPIQFPAIDIGAQLNPVLAWAGPILVAVGAVMLGIHMVFKRSAKLG